MNEGVDMLLVNTAGIDGAPKKLLTTAAVVVTGGGGVKSGCVRPLRFSPATPENEKRNYWLLQSFHVNLKNTVGIEVYINFLTVVIHM